MVFHSFLNILMKLL